MYIVYDIHFIFHRNQRQGSFMTGPVWRLVLLSMSVSMLVVMSLLVTSVLSMEFALLALMLMMSFPLFTLAFPSLAVGHKWLYSKLERNERDHHEK